jgi:hypothetical protein
MSPRHDAESPQAKELQRLLERNQRRRDKARGELRVGRQELASLLAAGGKAGLTVASMSRTASISRETAYTLLRSRSDSQTTPRAKPG